MGRVQGSQSRDPRQAAAAARADRAAEVWPELVDNELPALPVMWARWAVLAATFVAVGSERGPRVRPSAGSYDSAHGDGSSLRLVPRGRAVLSGGGANPAAGEGNLYAGAPAWVADPVLNPRAAAGRLTFCYWWEGGRWYRGESPSAQECSHAVPGVWTAEATAGVVAAVVARHSGGQRDTAAADLVTAAEDGTVTRDTLVGLFGGDGMFDVDGALYQLTLADVAAAAPEPMPERDAVARVRSYILARGHDTTDYPLEELVADRFSVGWMVYVPVPAGQVKLGRAVFYVTDDGVLEPSSSSTAPSVYVAEAEVRFRQRHSR